MKKGTRTISEYLLQIRAFVAALQALGDLITEQDHIDTVLEGLPEEYNSFVMLIYGRADSPSIDDIEALLMVQDSQFEKFRQELPSSSSISVNVAQASNLSDAAPNVNDTHYESQRGGYQGQNCGGRGGRGRGRGGPWPTCQLCGKYMDMTPSVVGTGLIKLLSHQPSLHLLHNFQTQARS